MAQATITRTIHVGDKAIPISDHRVVDLLRDGVIYECGDGHDLHIDPSAYANVDALERLLSGIAEASAPTPTDDDKVFLIGDTTMRRVFEPAGLRNMSDMQAVMDAVEKALKEPAGGEVKGLPVAGYKPTQPDWAVALVNENKLLEERVLRQIEKHGPASTDGRWVSIAKTQIEQGFMALNRAVFKPGRVTLPEDKA